MRDDLVSRDYGRVAVEVVCGECGSRVVGVVQRDARVMTPRGEVRTGFLLRYALGKARNGAGDKGLAYGETLVGDQAEREVVCPRHGRVVVDMQLIRDAVTSGTAGQPRVVRAVRLPMV